MAQRGRYVNRTWPGNPTGQTRSERVPARFKAYVPEPLAEYDPPVSAQLSALLSDADAAVVNLNRIDSSQAGQIEALARQLLRQESLASSRIEGLSLSHKRLGEAAYEGSQGRDQTASAVLANIAAMEQAIADGTAAKRVTGSTIQALHHTLMAEIAPEIAGKLRTQQNWVGGRWHTPIGAEFIPPPPEDAGALLTDLAKFINRTDLPSTLQAALAHAQFETIHPFADGNGRIGRCLIHVVYRRRGAATHQVPPVSLLMATDVDRYVKALTAFRGDREQDWSSYFAQTTIAAATAGTEFAQDLFELQAQWRAQASARSGSAANKLIDLLPAYPVLDVEAAAKLTDSSVETARRALATLETHGVIVRANSGRWRRAWQANGLWNLLDRFEERLATSDTELRPSRPAPQTR